MPAGNDKFYNLDMVTFDDTASAAGAVTINLANLTPELQPASITFDNATRDYTLNGTGFIGGGTGITKSGAAKVTLANSAVNTFTGPIVINAGTLQIGDGVNSGGIPGTQNITDNGAMIIDRPDNSAISGVISGSGSLTQMGTGTTLTLSNANTYTGATTIWARRLQSPRWPTAAQTAT